MNYLQPALLSAPPALEITKTEYEILKQSREILNAAFSFEENYDLLIGNYLEFEGAALSLATYSMARRRHEYHEMFEAKSELNRRAVNFLSSARLFVDQLPQRVRQCAGNVEDIKKKVRAEYDSSFEYRFMEALRNHVQHSGSAIHTLSFGAKSTALEKSKRIEYSVEVFTLKRFLALDEAFKKSVLDACPEKVDLLSATRKYLESLSVVHEFCRNHIDRSIVEARSAFESAIKRYVDFSKASAIGLTAFDSSNSKPSGAVSVFLDWDDVRIKLSKRNKDLKNLSDNVVMSAST